VRAARGLTPEGQAALLGLDLAGLAELSLCRMPGPGEREAVAQIAGHVGLSEERLAALLGVD
jgi:hypothetical protein